MKVLLYKGKIDVEKSGVGRAVKHQEKALTLAKIPYTLDIKDNWDIIHINTIFPSSLLVAEKSKKEHKKVIIHAHSTEEDIKNSFLFSNMAAPALKQWLKILYNKADIILTPTSYAKKLLESYGISKEIIPISNGIDLKFWKNDKEGRHRFRKKYGFKESDKVIMSVGLLIERKGIIEFLELAKRMPEYKFIWFGHDQAALRTPKVMEAIKQKTDNVYFPGYCNSEQLKDAYSGCDVYIFPTKEETEGIVLLEALAMKTKTIISDIPIYDDWLFDGVNIYKAKNIDEFEDKIKKIINNQLPNLTEEGYKIAEERSIEKIGLKLKNIYENIMEKDIISK